MASKATSASSVKLSEFVEVWQKQSGSTSKLVVEILREAIVSGVFKAGEPLRQDTIAAELGTSKIPIREALRQLEAEGLVKFIANRGAVVSEMSLPEMVEMFELRILLECRAIELAVPNLTAETFIRAEQIIEAAEVETNIAQWGELNWQFHSVLYLPASRPHLLSILEKIYTNSDRYVRLHISLTQAQTRSQAEHRAILEACKQRDSETAKQLLTSHLELAKTRLIGHLSETGLLQTAP
ncbi:GntR family transcriptional regulator [Oscillatoria sp. FACHB-1407]|uniref:GntR family transcriptional regulator n=1 Tax=Oscillatoria sp. FACHB-1407 TaxID=2692847 RepID=UPI00168604E7|nr:GntR family transcriptional regulator [Oscillatoria sp. FACHB-1407]MBD2460100.1 GntR family transcriptional regulator [Oscillatoria sp. FACHB-1407]